MIWSPAKLLERYRRWTCDVCETVYPDKPVVDSVHGCPECGTSVIPCICNCEVVGGPEDCKCTGEGRARAAAYTAGTCTCNGGCGYGNCTC